MTEEFIIEALRKNYGAPWLFFPHLLLGNGFNRKEVDAFAVHTWPSIQRRIAFEVKVSDSDFRKELADPLKRLPAYVLSTEFIFVSPEYVVHAVDVPVNCGLIWVKESGELVTQRKGIRPHKDSFTDGLSIGPSWDMMTRLLRDLVKNVPGYELSKDVP